MRVGSVKVAVLLTVMVSAIVAAYAALTWDRPHRIALLLLVGAASALAAAILLLPLDRIVRGRWREPFFLSWSMLNVLVVSAIVVVDGTDESPLALIYVLPLIFAASSYPLGMTIAVSVVDVGACLAVGVSDSGSAERALVLTGLLTAAAAMCSLQARNHDRQRAVLGRISRTDALTHVLNRRGFEERLTAALLGSARSNEPCALLLLDLDGFKPVNDRAGHAAGDALLQWTAQRIGGCVRPADVVGRIGGDEFAVLAPSADAGVAYEIAGRIGWALEDRIGVSIGVASYPADGTTVDELHRVADERLYSIKRDRQRASAHADGLAPIAPRLALDGAGAVDSPHA